MAVVKDGYVIAVAYQIFTIRYGGSILQSIITGITITTLVMIKHP